MWPHFFISFFVFSLVFAPNKLPAWTDWFLVQSSIKPPATEYLLSEPNSTKHEDDRMKFTCLHSVKVPFVLQHELFIYHESVFILTSFLAPFTPARNLGPAGRLWGRFAPPRGTMQNRLFNYSFILGGWRGIKLILILGWFMFLKTPKVDIAITVSNPVFMRLEMMIFS